MALNRTTLVHLDHAFARVQRLTMSPETHLPWEGCPPNSRRERALCTEDKLKHCHKVDPRIIKSFHKEMEQHKAYAKDCGLLERKTIDSILELNGSEYSKEEFRVLMLSYLTLARSEVFELNNRLSNIDDLTVGWDFTSGVTAQEALADFKKHGVDSKFAFSPSGLVSDYTIGLARVLDSAIKYYSSDVSPENNNPLNAPYPELSNPLLNKIMRAKCCAHQININDDPVTIQKKLTDIKTLANVILHLSKLEEKAQSKGEVKFLKPGNIDTGMSVYIPATTQAGTYNKAQEAHDGRPEARKVGVIPFLRKHLLALPLEKRIIAEMGPADGVTSTFEFFESLPRGTIYDCIEYDGGYASQLKANFTGCSEVKVFHQSIANYVPKEKLAAFVALGAFTDFSPNRNHWVELLGKYKRDFLQPGGVVILEEECPPFYEAGSLEARQKALAIQRGHIIFNALLRDEVELADMELKALLSSLSKNMGDYKANVHDFLKVFNRAGFNNVKVQKFFPRNQDLMLELSPQNLVYSPGDFKPPETLSGIDYYNYAFNELLQIHPDDPEPYNSIHFKNALQSIKELYLRMKVVKDRPGGLKMLKKSLGLNFVSGKNFDINHPEKDQTGGVYLFIAS